MDMRGRYAKLLEDYVSDIIGATIGSSAAGSGAAKDDSSAVIQSLDINQKVLELTTELASPRNIKEIIAFLEKEIVRARRMDESGDQAATTNEYRYLLIKSINTLT